MDAKAYLDNRTATHGPKFYGGGGYFEVLCCVWDCGKELSQDTRCPGRGSNRARPENKSRAFPLRLSAR
jgi:hypothetical protein